MEYVLLLANRLGMPRVLDKLPDSGFDYTTAAEAFILAAVGVMVLRLLWHLIKPPRAK
ncbi:MAG: hypothetical protein JSS43_28145 [Proteobacteria bacterium]|nr:hypothetical protein [Pseudomonadota bacterium]